MKKTIFASGQTNHFSMLHNPTTQSSMEGIVHKPFLHLFCTSMVAFALLLSPGRAYGQCPATTYTVGSGVGIPNLSDGPPGLANMVGGSVKIWGTFTVDEDTWSLLGVDVYLRTFDAVINVNSGCTLDARPNPNNNVRTKFENCPGVPSWSGIQVLSGGTAYLIDCIVFRACTAVDLRPGSKAQITGNTFISNFYSIDVEGATTLLGEGIAHNTFLPPPSDLGCSIGTNPYAIKLNNVPDIVIGDIAQSGEPNTMVDYPTGIHATNSNLTVYNTTIAYHPDVHSAAIRLIGNGGVFQATINGLGNTPTSPELINDCGR
ncbi:MAG: hypothetical protein ACKVUS_13195 [Saprospiraceae bacterium]